VTQLDITEVAPNRYRIGGELDMDSAPALERGLPVSGGSLILDLEDLTFIDSTGLHALVKLAARLNGAAPLVLDNVPAGVQRVLDIVGLESLPGIEVRHDV
jgi:anti-anti-sigma factor